MSEQTGLLPVRLPLWWRIAAWAAIVAVTVWSTHHIWSQVAAGVLMVIAAVLLQTVPLVTSSRLQALMVVVVSVAGLVTVLIASNGLGEVPVFLVVSRFPYYFDHPAGRAFVVADTIAVATVIGVITGSPAGALAGIAVPLLMQRAAEHRELVLQRDRAQALLAEVQAGREAEAQAAALSERSRIARDLHDVLAHSLAGLSLQLQAVRAVATGAGVGATILEPLDKAAALAQDGLAEAREAVSALRDPVGLGLAALPDLVERHPGRVALASTGTPASVSPEAEHALYRVVQESLTNAARYAPGSPVEIELSWQDGQLRARVDDSGPGPGRVAVAGQGTGLGLAGMQERLARVDGSLHAGPRAGGGWRVEAQVRTS
ncbi:MAG: sensor histidine kinase [Jatrophihabitantaceae bacterium]